MRIKLVFLTLIGLSLFGFLYQFTLITLKMLVSSFRKTSGMRSEKNAVNAINTLLYREKAINPKTFHDQNLVLIDRKILKRYEEAAIKDEKNFCIFCKVKEEHIVTFAVFYPMSLSQLNSIRISILNAFGTGFQVEKIISSNPKKFSPYRENLPLGFILYDKTGLVVFEIVLFHERKGNFWWHGSFHQDAQYESKLSNVHLKNNLTLNHEGAFDKFETKSVFIDGIMVKIPKNITQFLKESSRFIECNYEQAEKYYYIYGKDTSEKAVLFARKVKKVLEGAKKALDGLGIPFWLSSGTLLGYYRQCDVIPYTTDVDIEIFIEDYNYKIIQAFKDQHLKFYYILGKKTDGYEMSFWMNDVKVDIFFVYDGGDHFWYGALSREENSIHKYRYKYRKFSLCWTEFLELKLRIPCEAEDNIKAHYGPDWAKPVKDWSYRRNPYNLEKVGVWSKKKVPEFFYNFISKFFET